MSDLDDVKKEQEPSTHRDPTPREKERMDDSVDEQSEESFPASDAPSFTPVTSVSPPRKVEDKEYSKDELFPMLKDDQT
ncbi:MAG: hypothetical protein ACM3S1_05870 [Hyphomicrobiales bacterium]